MKATLNKLNKESPPRRLWRALLLCVLPLLLSAACGGGQETSAAPIDVDPTGTYTLASIDGKQVPCELTHEGHSMAIRSGIFIINADGTCSSKVAFSVDSGEEVNREVKANYTKEGRKLTMKWEGAGTTIGTVKGDTFTMDNEGMVFVYRK
jgi:hypothetical protein